MSHRGAGTGPARGGLPAAEADASADAAELLSAREGDLAAFNRVVLRHQDAVYALAYRFLGERQAAEDAAQEAFLRAYRSLARFRGGSARSWLLTIVANVARDELRRRRRRPELPLEPDRDDAPARGEPVDRGPTPEEQLLADSGRTELRAALEAALATLPEAWRMTVLLTDVHGLPHEEVARATGVAQGRSSRGSRAPAAVCATCWAASGNRTRPRVVWRGGDDARVAVVAARWDAAGRRSPR